MTIKHMMSTISAEDITTLFDIEPQEDNDNNLIHLLLTRKNFHDEVDSDTYDLLDYFYTKEEVIERIKIHLVVVESEENLPATGQDNYIYLVPFDSEGDHNEGIFKEFVWAEKSNGTFDYEEIGSTELNLDPILNDIDDLQINVNNLQNNKVDKVSGKGLSTNDFTNALKGKLDNIEDEANKYIHPNKHSVSMIDGLSEVAISGDYNDLSNTPSYIQPTQTDEGFLRSDGSIDDNEYLTSLPSHEHSGDQIRGFAFSSIGQSYTAIMSYYGLNSNYMGLNDVLNKILTTVYSKKVDKVSGKDLSTNDYTTAEKNKLAGLANVATTGSYNDLDDKPSIPTQTSQLENNSGFLTSNDISGQIDLSNYIQMTEIDEGFLKSDGSIDDNEYLTTLPTHNHEGDSVICEIEVDNQGQTIEQNLNNWLHYLFQNKVNTTDISDVATSGSYTDLSGITTQELSITYDDDGTDVTETITFLTVQRTNS